MNTRRIPNFYCIGAQKAGTTTLHELLKQHPDIYLPVIKEAHYFHKDHLYEKGLQWYLEKHFDLVSDEQMVGSITPEYLYFEKCAERIYQTFGSDMKFIVILRNPAERAYSHYKMSKFRGFETLTFQEAIEQEKERINKSLHNKIHFSYLDRGYYHKQIKRFLKYYPEENFLLINFENEFSKNLGLTIKKIFNFIGVNNLKLDYDIYDNIAKEAIIPKINQLLVNKPRFIQKITKKLPDEFKNKFKTFIKDINKSNANKDGLDHDYKMMLINNNFSDDIAELENNLTFTHTWLNNKNDNK